MKNAVVQLLRDIDDVLFINVVPFATSERLVERNKT